MHTLLDRLHAPRCDCDVGPTRIHSGKNEEHTLILNGNTFNTTNNLEEAVNKLFQILQRTRPRINELIR